MDNTCTPMVADLFFFVLSGNLCLFLVISDVCNNTYRCLDDILNINNIYFDNIVSQLYPSELQLIKSITLILKLRFWTCICPFLVKIYDKRDNFGLEIVKFPFLEGEDPCSTSNKVFLFLNSSDFLEH